MGGYDPAAIEPKWQERWRERRTFESRRDPARPKYYVYNPAPYVTGALHMGHVRNYACGDFVAKVHRLKGDAVLYTIGFDAFGLPTEMAAIRNSVAPEQWTADCLEQMRRQLSALGCGFDWSRSFLTCEPKYYRWTQWIFLQLHERGLIYSTVGTTLWCPECDTSLARAQAEEGRCWICGSTVERRRVREWMLRVSPYLGRLLRGLEKTTDRSGLAEQGQGNLIGRQDGFAVQLRVEGVREPLTAFLPDGASWAAPCVIAVDARDEETLAALAAGGGGGEEGAPIAPALADAVLAALPGARLTGWIAVEERTGRRLPVVVAPLSDPAFLDQPLVVPLAQAAGEGAAPRSPAPGFPPMTVYRQKDFSISRQRLWGTPIPIVLCETCGEVPVPVEELPVVAPGLTIDPGTGRLRREGDSWDLRRCPRCGAPARLDPQVMDCHMDSIWHPFRPCALESTEFLFDPDEVLYWMPADIIQFGRDVIPFMLDLRFFSYFLHDLGLVPFEEFCTEVLAHGLILHEGRKMSKHLGNAVTPEEAIERFGADALRFYALAHEEPKSDCRWSEEGIDRYRALLATFHGLVASAPAVERPAPPPATRDREPGARRSKYANVFLKKVAREIEGLASYVEETRYDRYASGVARMISSMEFFATNHLARERDPHVSRLWRSILEDAVAYLAPIAPHLAEECWEMLGKEDSIFSAARPPAVTAQAIRDLLEDSRHITTQGRDA